MPPSPTERLLTALIKADNTTTGALSSYLSASHSSHAALSAYASAHGPPLGDVLREIEGSLRGVHEAVRAYVGAMEMWSAELGDVKDKEEEVGAVRRDRDILVTRLIKATKIRPTSTHSLLPSLMPSSPHSSVLSLPSASDAPKLAHAQAELQACESHLAQRQRGLEETTKAAIARGVLRRCAALEELSDACRVASGRARGSLGSLVPAKYQNGSGNPYDKPLPTPGPYAHRPPPRAGSPSEDSLSPSQSASQIATYPVQNQNPHSSTPQLHPAYNYSNGVPQPQQVQRQSSEHHRRSLSVPPAHAITTTEGFVPDSRLLPAPELRPQPPPQQLQQLRPLSRQQMQSLAEDDDSSGSEEHGPLVVHENLPRNSMSFPTGSPPQPQFQQHQPPSRMPTVSGTPARRQSKHIALPSTQSDLGPRQPPPAVQTSSPQTLPRPRPHALLGQRRPSSRSLDSFELPSSRQHKKRGFFGAIAHALHIGGGSRDGRESPPYGGGSSGWKKEKGWQTRTDKRLREMHGWRGGDGNQSSDEEPGRVVVAVENTRGARPAVDRRGSESTNASGGAGKAKRLTKGAVGSNGSPVRAATQVRQRPPIQHTISPSEALESRLDAAARARTVSSPSVPHSHPHFAAAREPDGFTRMRTISEASGTGNRRSMAEMPGAPLTREGTVGKAAGKETAATLGRSGTVKSTMSAATAPVGIRASGPLGRSGTVNSTMSAPGGTAFAPAGTQVKKKAVSGPAHRQVHRAGHVTDGGPNILTVLDSGASAAPSAPAARPANGPSGLLEIKAPGRVFRDPSDGLISVKAPAPTGALLGLPSPPPASSTPLPMSNSAPAHTSAAAGAGPRGNGHAGLSRVLSTSTSASTAHAPKAAATHARPAQPTPVLTNSNPTSPTASHARSLASPSPAAHQPSRTQEAKHFHHTPVPSAFAPAPTRSALRTRSPSPLPPPALISEAIVPMKELVPLPATAQPRPEAAELAAKQRPPSSATIGTSGDDSSYETGLEDQEESGSESEYSGTPGQGTPRMAPRTLDGEQESTPTTVRSAPPVPVLSGTDTGSGSGVSESTAMSPGGFDKPARRKSVRLDVPPSLTGTPAMEDFPSNQWNQIPDLELANAVPSRSYLTTGSSATAVSQPTSRHSQAYDGLPLPSLPPKEPEVENVAEAGWHIRTSRPSSQDSSDEEGDEEYARVKRELEEANRRWAKAGHLSGKRR